MSMNTYETNHSGIAIVTEILVHRKIQESYSLEWRLSGGQTNTDPLFSLGGEMSSTVFSGSVLFPLFSRKEVETGVTKYACLYLVNTSQSPVYGVHIYAEPESRLRIGFSETNPASAIDDSILHPPNTTEFFSVARGSNLGEIAVIRPSIGVPVWFAYTPDSYVGGTYQYSIFYEVKG